MTGVPEQARPTALRELIAQEVDLRRAAGKSVDPAEYHERFAEDAAEVDAAFERRARRQRINNVPFFADCGLRTQCVLASSQAGQPS